MQQRYRGGLRWFVVVDEILYKMYLNIENEVLHF